MTAPDGRWLGDQPADVLTAAELDRVHADDYTAWDLEMRDFIPDVPTGQEPF